MALSLRSVRCAFGALTVAALVLAGAACKERAHDAPSRTVDASAPPDLAGETTPPPAVRVGATSPRAGALPAQAAALPVAVPALPASDWVWKSYRGDAFTVLFPGEPRVAELPAEDGKAGFTEASLHVPGGQVSFAVGFTERSPEDLASPDAFLDERANPPRRGETEILYQRAATLAGHPGRVLILRRDISGTPLRVYSRLYLVDRRLYSLIVSTLDVGGVSEDVVKRFMESFKLS